MTDKEHDALIDYLIDTMTKHSMTYAGPGTAPLVGYPFSDVLEMLQAVIVRLEAEWDQA